MDGGATDRIRCVLDKRSVALFGKAQRPFRNHALRHVQGDTDCALNRAITVTQWPDHGLQVPPIHIYFDQTAVPKQRSFVSPPYFFDIAGLRKKLAYGAAI